MKQYLLLAALGFLLIACSATPPLPVATTEPTRPPATAVPSPLPPTASPIPPTAAPTSSPRPPAATPDPCAAATAAGARQKLTFEQLVPCLSTPQRLLEFMINNLKWDGGWDTRAYGGNAYSPAAEVYQNGTDDCDGLAEFAACVLRKNGYESYQIGIGILGPLGHNVAGYIGGDGKKYSIDNGQSIEGPFDTWEQLAQFHIEKQKIVPPGVLWLFEPCITSRATGNAVLKIPHKVLR